MLIYLPEGMLFRRIPRAHTSNKGVFRPQHCQSAFFYTDHAPMLTGSVLSVADVSPDCHSLDFATKDPPICYVRHMANHLT